MNPTTLAAAPTKASQERADVTKKPRRSIPWMRWVRRIHMYLGLVLLPWVILYGITGFLFNHTTAFSDREALTIPPEQLDPDGRWATWNPRVYAREVVDALRHHHQNNGDGSAADGSEKSGEEKAFRFGEPDNVELSGTFFLSGDEEGDQESRRHSVRLQSDGMVKARVTTSVLRKQRESAPFEVKRGLDVEGDPVALATDLVSSYFEREGRSIEELRVRRSPRLEFDLPVDGDLWRVTYDPRSGSVNADKKGTEVTLGTRSFLTRLHLARGYPMSPGVRTVWAVIVDAMAAAMVLWGGTGLLMWWQLKRTRVPGSVFVLFSLALAAVLAFGMYRSLT